MHQFPGPANRPLNVPESSLEDRQYFGPEALAQARAYFEEEGYVVLRGLVPLASCRAVRERFAAEMRPSRAYILRQANMRYERHHFGEHGFMMNPIFNVQDLETRRFAAFKRAALDVLTHSAVQDAAAALLGRRPMLVQSMYFEGNPETWPHQDTYYQDSDEPDGCVAAWFALEDIDAGAGRFFVYPGTHRMKVTRNAGAFDFAFHHDNYKRHMGALMAEGAYQCRIPFMAAGDVLFWGSRTVHGSCRTVRPDRSRSSLTAHYLREGSRMVQFHSRYKELNLKRYNGVPINHLHDQDVLANRIVRELAVRFPVPYSFARSCAIRLLTLFPRAAPPVLWDEDRVAAAALDQRAAEG